MASSGSRAICWNVLRDPARAHDRVFAEDRPLIEKARAAAAASGNPLDMSVRFERDGGSLGWCRMLSAPRKQDDGFLIWDGVHFDATSDMETRRQLDDLNSLMSLRLRSRTGERDRARDSLVNMEAPTRIGSWVYDPSQPTLEWSESVFEMFGLPPQSAPPTYEEFLSSLPDDQRAFIEHIVQCKDFERTWKYRLTVGRPDGSARTVLVHARLEPSEGSREPVLFGVCCDVTEKDHADAAAERSQKMGAIGKLTSGLAHDFNNLLSITIGSLDLIRSTAGKDESISELCENALPAVLHAPA